MFKKPDFLGSNKGANQGSVPGKRRR